MATYRPDPAAFARQVESLRAQDTDGWHCWVSDDGSGPEALEATRDVLGDDDRFTLHAHPDNVGFYRNFERGLAAVRGKAPWVALADQDDVWTPRKLRRLLDAVHGTPGARMAYCDVEIRADDGTLLSPTYWQGRRHNEQDLAALLFANTVSGAASLFPDELLAVALPFPAPHPSSFHDHWLAVAARVTGTIVYVDEALQAYVQHRHNAIGHRPGGGASVTGAARRLLGRRFWERPELRYYDDEVARLAQMASTLLERTSPTADDRRVLRAVASLHGPRPAAAWLARQAMAEARDPSITMVRRRRVLASVAWTQLERVVRTSRP